MNEVWHRSYPMPGGATEDQRVAWHAAHEMACGCRRAPAELRAKVDRRKNETRNRPASH